MRGRWVGVLGCVVGAGLVLGGLSPTWAAPGGAAENPAATAQVGGFTLGDGLEGTIDEQSGAGRFAVPAGGLSLMWDSRAIGADRFSLGAGWELGTGWVQTEGGLRVFPASGGAYEVDASSPSGLRGYTLADLRFDRSPGVLPSREDGTRGEVAYEFVLHELGGATTYFGERGDPLAGVALHGDRRDWIWADGEEHRLAAMIDPDGVATELDWRGEQVRVTPGAKGSGERATWVIDLSRNRVSGVTDPEGGRIDIVSEPSGLVTGLAGTSGARTEVTWRSSPDGLPRVERIATFGADGAVLSARTWRAVGETVSSGWPATEAVPGAIVPGSLASGFSTLVGDGPTEIESTYNALGSLIRRLTTATTASGREVLQEQSFSYPSTDEDGTPNVATAELPKQWSLPSSGTSTFRDRVGGERTTSRHTEFDEFGRAIQRIDRIRVQASEPWSATTTTYVYDGYDRLTESAVHDSDTGAAPSRRTRYEHSVGGDITRETVTTAPGTPDERSVARAFSYGPSGTLTAITTTEADGATSTATQDYDGNANLTRDLDGTVFAYDAADRLIRDTTADGSTTHTSYWADGSRRRLSTAGDGEPASTTFYWDGPSLLNDAHARAGERATASYLLAGSRVARTVSHDIDESGATAGAVDTSYLGTDRHGNTTDLTDEHGAVTERYTYTDYGVTEAAVGPRPAAVGDPDRNPIQYASAYADPSGRLHLDARDYDPGTARFTTADRARELTNYAYADLNPVMKVDPSGRSGQYDTYISAALIGLGLLSSVFTLYGLLSVPLATASLGVRALSGLGALAVGGQFTSVTVSMHQLVAELGGFDLGLTAEEQHTMFIVGIAIGAVSDVVGLAVGGALVAMRFGAGAGETAVKTETSALTALKETPSNPYAGKSKVQIMQQLGGDVQKNATQLMPGNAQADLLVAHGKTMTTDAGVLARSTDAATIEQLASDALTAHIDRADTLIDSYVKSLGGAVAKETPEPILEQTHSLLSIMRKDLADAAKAAGIPREGRRWGHGPVWHGRGGGGGGGSTLSSRGGGGFTFGDGLLLGLLASA